SRMSLAVALGCAWKAPRTASLEVLAMSPSKRRTVTGCPAGEVSWSTCDLVSLCTIDNLRIFCLVDLDPGSSFRVYRWRSTLLFIQPDDQPHIAAFAVGPGHPLGLVDKGLDKKHSHAAGVFFAVHLAVD